MADSCAKCVKSLKNAKVKVSCADCKSGFHPRCANLTSEDISFMVENEQVWRCDPCAQTRRKSMVLESKSDVTYDDILKLFSELKSEFSRVEKSLNTSINSCHEELAETKSVIATQTTEIQKWVQAVETLTAENSALKRRVAELEAKQEEAEQYSRRNTLEIYGVPMQRGEDVVSLVQSVGRALDYPIEDSMIDACHRLRGRDGSGKPPGIVVKMVRRLDAEGLLQKRRVKRNLSTHDLGLTDAPAEVVYVNESLSPGRRRLLNVARQVKRDKQYTYLWIRGGKILMRKSQGDPVKVISTAEDLKTL